MNFHRSEGRERRWLGRSLPRLWPSSWLPSLPSVKTGWGRLPAFTLIELLVFIAIIASLACLLSPHSLHRPG